MFIQYSSEFSIAQHACGVCRVCCQAGYIFSLAEELVDDLHDPPLFRNWRQRHGDSCQRCEVQTLTHRSGSLEIDCLKPRPTGEKPVKKPWFDLWRTGENDIIRADDPGKVVGLRPSDRPYVHPHWVVGKPLAFDSKVAAHVGNGADTRIALCPSIRSA